MSCIPVSVAADDPEPPPLILNRLWAGWALRSERDYPCPVGTSVSLGECRLPPKVTRTGSPAGPGVLSLYVLGQERDGGPLLWHVLDCSASIAKRRVLGRVPTFSSCKSSEWGQPQTASHKPAKSWEPEGLDAGVSQQRHQVNFGRKLCWGGLWGPYCLTDAEQPGLSPLPP